ncbi:hypothetical protein B484DRAFT_142174 [Ochromonadaceae sp. CCMP2298]|nr:hypothetical protein B484DRAFT_142174 [Ochromonadaceae sp. CCMP2298]
MSSPPPSKDKQGFPRPRREGGGRVGRGERISFQGKEGFPKEPASRTVKLAAAPPENDHRMGKAEKEQIFYGIISTIKQGFGFIQPLLDDEQIFMSARELYVDIKLGDRVGFFVRQSPRGLAAEVVHRIAPNLEKVVENVKGTVSRGTDRHRSGVGTITIDMALLDADVTAQLADLARKEVVFMPADVLPRTVPKNHRLDKGDYVQFSIFRVTGSTLFVAASISFVQLKRDRAVALQIQRMLDAGVKRELGIVSALKNGEYGFIKALDRKDEIYFRMEDGRAQGSSPEDGVDDKLGEGSEIEFFVITEMVKGKMSDRAIHVKVVPKGTVKFELVVAAGVEACVIAESASHPEETPGIARLMLSLSTEVVGSLSEGSSGHLDVIELWQRCLPDEMTCAVGDMLLLDVHFYRPEKLFFARNVKIGQYRRLGREVGTICSLKENGFGFIHSALRSADLYFKYSHVLGWDSLPVAESALKVGAVITFDVSFESTNQGGKLKAKRVMIQKAESKVKEDSRYIMKEDISLVRVWSKRRAWYSTTRTSWKASRASRAARSGALCRSTACRRQL